MSRAAGLATGISCLGISVALAFGGAFLPDQKPDSLSISIPVGENVICPMSKGANNVVTVFSEQDSTVLAPVAENAVALPVKKGTIEVMKDLEAPVSFSSVERAQGSAAAMAVSEKGLQRGIAFSRCFAPNTSAWFVGVEMGKYIYNEIVLVNVDAATASVDISFYGPTGRIMPQGTRSIQVRPNSPVTLPLDTLLAVEKGKEEQYSPLTIHVETAAGRVASFVRTQIGDEEGISGRGVAWVQPSVEPGTEIVIPGVMSNLGGQLEIVNPDQIPAEASVEVLGENGLSISPGYENVLLAGESTTRIDLKSVMGENKAAVRIRSDRPVTASVRLGQDNDIAYVPAGVRFSGISYLPLVFPNADTVTLLTNPGEQEVTVLVGTRGEDGQKIGEDKQVRIAPLSTVMVAVGRAEAEIVEVNPGGNIYASVIVTQNTGSLAGLGAVAIRDTHLGSVVTTPKYDHQVGQ